jgi:ribosomal protein L35
LQPAKAIVVDVEAKLKTRKVRAGGEGRVAAAAVCGGVRRACKLRRPSQTGGGAALLSRQSTRPHSINPPETNTHTPSTPTKTKAAAKRLKVTGSGKVVARRSGKQHFNEKMSRAHKRELSKDFVLSKGDAYAAIGSLPYHGINR